MSIQQTDSTVSSTTAPAKKHNTNGHEAAVCAVQIDLKEYAHQLEFLSKYVPGRNNYRIDLLVIKQLTGEVIPKSIAHTFKTYNLFEIKGISSSLSSDSYYKTLGYAGLLINQYTALDVSLSFLSFYYPRDLMKHLHDERKLTVEKLSRGVYHIINETFIVQIIVTRELSPEEYLYLHCLTDHLNDAELIKRLVDDYRQHQTQDIYNRYMKQLINANTSSNTKGESPMLFEELMERAREEMGDYYQDKIEQLSSTNEQLSSSNAQLSSFIEQLSSKIDHLENLLKQHNIQFD